mgnify:FL=1
MNVEITAQAAHEIESDLLVFFVSTSTFSDPEGAAGALVDALEENPFTLAGEEGFKGSAKQSCMLRAPRGVAARRLLLVGVGDGEANDYREASARAARQAKKSRAQRVALFTPDADAAALSAAHEGFLRGEYDFKRYVTPKEDDEYEGVTSLTLVTEVGGAQDIANRTAALGAGVRIARNLVNDPPQSLIPEVMATRAESIATRNNLEHKIFKEDELEMNGFNLIMAVGKGSDSPPRLIHLIYRPDGEVKHKVAFVGKGVTFDTGGYNIKTGGFMYNMHCDMGGGAAVLGAAEAIGRIKPAGVEVHFIVPSVENSISGNAMRPNDIYRGYGNKTVEIGNTDAEGRLILADALAYAQEQEVDTIIDLATLTGACVVALGDYTSGLFTDDEGLAGELQGAIDRSGEDFWRMPLHKKLDGLLDSPYADMKNVGKRAGGAITAALFLKRWVNIERWAHLDIAGPAFMEGESDAHAAGGTGFGVTTLVELAAALGG